MNLNKIKDKRGYVSNYYGDVKKLDKEACQKEHFKKRYLERVGEPCNRFLYKSIIENIKHHKLRRLEKQSNRVSLYEYNIDYVLFYDKSREALITIITYEDYMLHKGKYSEWRNE